MPHNVLFTLQHRAYNTAMRIRGVSSFWYSCHASYYSRKWLMAFDV